MITLSIRQPWAWLIVHGYKDIENREWPTQYRGPILIHAGKTLTRPQLAGVLEQLVAAGIPEVIQAIPKFEDLPRGGVVGVSEIAACTEYSDSPWFMGPYGFVMRNSRPLPFFPVNGQLKFFNVRGVELAHA